MRRRARGFTLVELLVSLTAGLIIAIAVAGLAKVATNTFYEESRVQVAELSLRIAVDRLRSDLSRASYMGTSNILADPLVVKLPNQPTVTVPSQFAGGLGLLAGVRYVPNGTIDAPTNIGTLSALNFGAGVMPDRLVIGGNMTTADEYIVQSILQDGQGCNGSTVTLSVDSPAIARLIRDSSGAMLSSANATAALRAAFAPVTVTGGTQPTWMARIVDDSGKHQFVALCTNTPVAMVTSATTGLIAPQIYVQPATNVLSATETSAQGGSSGFGVGRLTINPVQLVEWSVRDRTATTTTPSWARDNSPDAATKFDLMREYLDATGARVGSPELVAEYVVDFEIALVSENPSPTATPRMQLTAFDATNEPNAAVTAATAVGPQWVRSLRYRVATRAPTADRELTLTSPAAGYAYRYCTDIAGCATSRRWARVRTLTGEVTLMNQTRYP